MKRYIFRLLISLDQLLNTITNGEPDETLSSRLGRNKRRKTITGKIGCEILDTIDKDHCEISVEEIDDPHHMGKVIREITIKEVK